MTDDWIQTLVQGEAAMELAELKISGKHIGTFTGNGHVEWTPSTGIRVRAATGNANALFDEHLRRITTKTVPGKIVHDDDFLQTIGETQSGDAVEVSPTHSRGFNIHGDSPTAFWDFGVLWCRRRHVEEFQLPVPRTIRVLVGPSPTLWLRHSVTEVRNEAFPERRSSLDWMLGATNFGKVAAKRISDEWFEVRVQIEQPMPDVEALQFVWACEAAFSFLLGRRLVFRGYQERTPEATVRYLRDDRRKPTEGFVAAPLGFSTTTYHDHAEDLLGPAVDFFLMPRGRRVVHYLNLLWDTADNAWPVQWAVVGVCLEGLISDILEDSKIAEPSLSPADRVVFDRWLANDNGLSPRGIARLRGFAGLIGHRRVADVLKEWRDRRILDTTQGDLDAWQRMRNSAAHGQLVVPPDDKLDFQPTIDQSYQLQNVVNRIVLNLIGYRGPYIDYSKPGWRQSPAPEIGLDGPITP
jgi:hypothetical protein